MAGAERGGGGFARTITRGGTKSHLGAWERGGFFFMHLKDA